MPLQHLHEHEEQPALPRLMPPSSAVQETPPENLPLPTFGSAQSAQSAQFPDTGSSSNAYKSDRRTSSASSASSMRVLWRHLTPQQRILLTMPILVYLLLAPVTFGWIDLGFHDAGLTGVLLYLIAPTVLAVYLGVKSKSRRFGTLTGVLTGFMAVLSGAIHSTVGFHYVSLGGAQINILAQCLTVGAILGVGGAFVGGMIRKPRSQTTRRIKRRLRVRVVMENAE